MTALLKYDAARKMLADARKVDEVKSIRDKAEAMRAYARMAGDQQLMIDAATIKVYAERRLGELIIAAKDAGHISTGPMQRIPSKSEGIGRVRLEDAGIDHKLSHMAQKRAGIGARAFETMVSRMRERMAEGGRVSFDTIIKETDLQRARSAHEQKTYEGGSIEDLHALARSGAKFGAIGADPAWTFQSWSDAGQDRAASNHYTLSSLEQMKAMPVEALAADDCVLFIWVLNPMLPQALELIEAWGFTFKTVAFAWVKASKTGEAEHMGTGYWTRANMELCLLATRGKPQRLNADVRELLVHPVMEHSRKPDEYFERIFRLVAGPYLELFARRPREGVVTWGNELPAVSPSDALTILHAENGGLEPGRDFDSATGEILETGGDMAVAGEGDGRGTTAPEAAPAAQAPAQQPFVILPEDDGGEAAMRALADDGANAASGTRAAERPNDLDIPPFLRRVS